METVTKTDVKVWSLDPTHSTLHFAVKHMVIAQAKGSFTNYTLIVKTQGLDFSDAKIELEIDVNSINTNSSDRDNHLRAADFFDVAQFPVINFISKSWIKINDEEYKLIGDITIKGITKSIEFKVNYGGQLVDPWGNIRAGFTIDGTIDRYDFGLSWNSVLETGNAMLGKMVKLQAEFEIVTAK